MLFFGGPEEKLAHVLVLSDGSEIPTRAVIVATGARYRRLAVPDLDRFEGAGVYYAATDLEARVCGGLEVFVLGGGNSAGQAAIYLAQQGSQVSIAIRRDDLSASMSHYLIERIDALRAISRQNAGATIHVAEEQKAVTVQATQLATLQASHARETSAVLVQRDEVAQLHLALVNRQLEFVRARDRKSSELETLQSHKQSLEGELAHIQARELAASGVGFSGPIGAFNSTPEGAYGFFPASGTNYSVGEEPVLAAHLNTLGKALHLHLIGISGYRSPQHSVEVGGFANDPHTRGEASDTPGVEGVPEATLNQFGLTRPFPGAAEADHIQLLGSAH